MSIKQTGELSGRSVRTVSIFNVIWWSCLVNGDSGTGCVLLSAQPDSNAVAATIDKMMDFMEFLHISGKRKPARGGYE
ncbi:hypothetical protein D6V60_004307 [Escherichia coli]|nr:hypothetical protein [Escherichia coli]